MDAKKAIHDTVDMIYNERALLPKEGPCSYAHLAGMVITVNSADFSYGKLCRWLGYMQGVAVALGLASLEEMKDINRKHAND